MQNGRQGWENYSFDCPSSIECIERAASSSNVLGITIAMAQTSADLDSVKLLSGIDPPLPPKTKKTMERSDPKKYVKKCCILLVIYIVFQILFLTCIFFFFQITSFPM